MLTATLEGMMIQHDGAEAQKGPEKQMHLYMLEVCTCGTGMRTGRAVRRR